MTNYLSIKGTSLFKHRWILPLLTSLPPTAQKHNPAQRPNNPCFSPHSVENKIPWLHYIFQKPLAAHLELHLLSNTCNYVNDSVGLEGQFKEGLQAAEHRTYTPGRGRGDLQPLHGCESFQPKGCSPTTSSIPAAWNWEGNLVENPPRHLGLVFTSTGSPEGSFASEADGTEGWTTLVWTNCDNSFCPSPVGTSVRNSLSDGLLLSPPHRSTPISN